MRDKRFVILDACESIGSLRGEKILARCNEIIFLFKLNFENLQIQYV